MTDDEHLPQWMKDAMRNQYVPDKTKRAIHSMGAGMNKNYAALNDLKRILLGRGMTDAERNILEKAERNILEKMVKEWHEAELLYYREGVRIGDECRISDGHITAGELRAAFGRGNPLIEAFEKEKGEG